MLDRIQGEIMKSSLLLILLVFSSVTMAATQGRYSTNVLISTLDMSFRGENLAQGRTENGESCILRALRPANRDQIQIFLHIGKRMVTFYNSYDLDPVVVRDFEQYKITHNENPIDNYPEDIMGRFITLDFEKNSVIIEAFSGARYTCNIDPNHIQLSENIPE
jgi:hypothetical protein